MTDPLYRIEDLVDLDGEDYDKAFSWLLKNVFSNDLKAIEDAIDELCCPS